MSERQPSAVMSAREYSTRLWLYVLVAVLGTLSTEIDKLDPSDWRSMARAAVAVMLSGAITWRAFIDKSSTVTPPTNPNQ